MEVVRDAGLILQQPVDARFVVHRLVNGLGSRLAIGLEQDVVIDFSFGVEADPNPSNCELRTEMLHRPEGGRCPSDTTVSPPPPNRGWPRRG